MQKIVTVRFRRVTQIYDCDIVAIIMRQREIKRAVARQNRLQERLADLSADSACAVVIDIDIVFLLDRSVPFVDSVIHDIAVLGLGVIRPEQAELIRAVDDRELPPAEIVFAKIRVERFRRFFRRGSCVCAVSWSVWRLPFAGDGGEKLDEKSVRDEFPFHKAVISYSASQNAFFFVSPCSSFRSSASVSGQSFLS